MICVYVHIEGVHLCVWTLRVYIHVYVCLHVCLCAYIFGCVFMCLCVCVAHVRSVHSCV